MAAGITEVRGNRITVALAGTLTAAELAHAHGVAADVIQRHGTVSILVLADRFDGWEAGADWGDFSFSERFDAFIERMAIVGDPRLEEAALMFVTSDLRPFPIRYFPPEALQEAQAWLGGS